MTPLFNGEQHGPDKGEPEMEDFMVNIGDVINPQAHTILRNDKQIVFKGTCVIYSLKKIVFSRKPRDDFEDDVRGYLTECGSLFSRYDTKCKITLENYRNILFSKNIILQNISGDLELFYKMAAKRTNDTMYLVSCELNDKYWNKSNKFLKKNPRVKEHLVIFKRGNILCPYLDTMKLSLTKHLAITSNEMGTSNTSSNSYISSIDSIYEVVKL